MREAILSSNHYMKSEFPFWITRTVQGSIDEHGHEFVELVFVVRGNGRHLFQGSRYDIQAGDVFIINPGETHAYAVEPGEQMEIINCLFMPSFIPDALLTELEITNSMDYFYVHPFLTHDVRFNHRVNLNGQEASHVLALLEGMIREMNGRPSGHKTIIRLRLIELLVLLSRYYSLLQQQRAHPSPRQLEREMTAKRIYGYLERNYEKKITLQSLASLFNASIRQLNRLMREEYDRSVFEVLHEIRIERAKHLLLETDEKVIVVATMVGYEDQSFFNRLFARHVGCSPSHYRSTG
ncbi:helix-turn-helix domain-containing protein [Paenibacillus sp. MWE-103]|uniref:Helix-turn-helix domain-containing protein n=1 Tax=Paenibacillus artemisiicola TaxID=1172618 RepID=A0ABS3W2R3_9BACL|nr:AraC family transcriptional regulator [Paenibacillus artemisiicola]MBO7742587.1 helix-turn-helix domain-containing protein [Paenibacillus artemisiicola]